MKYTLFKTSGEIVHIERDKPLVMADLQELVGGWIEVVDQRHEPNIAPGFVAVINEEGRINGMEKNHFFVDLYGPVVLTESENIK